jgi:hypothetical protein
MMMEIRDLRLVLSRKVASTNVADDEVSAAASSAERYC